MLGAKREILNGAGYAYHFDRGLYYSRQDKKAFSVEFIDDHTEEELKKRIREAVDGKRWHFYSSFPLSESVRRELERVLG
jgi:hypothetical protein